MIRQSNRTRKKRVISDLGGPLRKKATGSRHTAKNRPQIPHGNVKGEREIRIIARRRCENLLEHIERKQNKVWLLCPFELFSIRACVLLFDDTD